MPKRLLTIDELATLLNVHKGYIYQLNYLGKIPGRIRLGARTVRYDADEIDRWLEQLKRDSN